MLITEAQQPGPDGLRNHGPHPLFPKPTSKRKLFVPCPVRKPRPSWRPAPPFVPPAYLISGDALSCPPGLLLLFFVLSPGACGRVLLLPVSDLLSRFDSSCVFYFSFFFLNRRVDLDRPRCCFRLLFPQITAGEMRWDEPRLRAIPGAPPVRFALRRVRFFFSLYGDLIPIRSDLVLVLNSVFYLFPVFPPLGVFGCRSGFDPGLEVPVASCGWRGERFLSTVRLI